MGANEPASVTGLEELPGKINYFMGSDPSQSHTDVPTYAKVRYEEVYPASTLSTTGRRGGSSSTTSS